MEIQKAEEGNLSQVAAFAAKLWTGCELSEVLQDVTARYLAGEAFFLAYEQGEPIGFAEVSLRQDYVKGSETSPVGYLEGIFVKENARRHGAAKQLLSACEAWAREQGAREFASDCRIDNETSASFHRACGFAEAGRILCFIKALE